MLYKIQMNLFAKFQNLCTSYESKAHAPDRQTIPLKSFDKIVQGIYEQKILIKELNLPLEQFQFHLSIGEMYTIIRDHLQNVCKVHRRLIMDSVDVMWGDKLLVNKIDCEDYENVELADYEECIVRINEAIVWIIYQHYCSISESNKQVCFLWRNVTNNIDGSFSHKISKDHNFQLKQDILNQLALKELIPNSTSFQTQNFKQTLQMLLESPSVNEKSHLEELKTIYNCSQSTKTSKYKTKTMKICMQIQSSESCWMSHLKKHTLTNKLMSKLNVGYDWLLNDELFSFCQDTPSIPSFKSTVSNLSPKGENEQNKKKKNKKRKKKKGENGNKKQEKEQQIKVEEEKVTPIREEKADSPKKQHQKTIKMLKQMKIEKQQRCTCCISDSNLQKWFKRIRNQGS